MNVAQISRWALFLNTTDSYNLSEEDAVYDHEKPYTNIGASQRVPSKIHNAHFPTHTILVL
jgi:hypothetical protein